MQFSKLISQFIITTKFSRGTKLQEQILKVNHRDDLNFEVCIMF